MFHRLFLIVFTTPFGVAGAACRSLAAKLVKKACLWNQKDIRTSMCHRPDSSQKMVGKGNVRYLCAGTQTVVLTKSNSSRVSCRVCWICAWPASFSAVASYDCTAILRWVDLCCDGKVFRYEWSGRVRIPSKVTDQNNTEWTWGSRLLRRHSYALQWIGLIGWGLQVEFGVPSVWGSVHRQLVGQTIHKNDSNSTWKSTSREVMISLMPSEKCFTAAYQYQYQY